MTVAVLVALDLAPGKFLPAGLPETLGLRILRLAGGVFPFTKPQLQRGGDDPPISGLGYKITTNTYMYNNNTINHLSKKTEKYGLRQGCSIQDTQVMFLFKTENLSIK